MSNDYLFSTHALYAVIEAQKTRILEEISGIAADRLLNTSSDAWVEYFEDRYRLAPPSLDDEGITVDQDEANVVTRAFFDRSQTFVKGTEVTVFVPFTGEEDLFKCAPSTRLINPPRGRVAGGELVLRYTRLDHDAEALKREIDRDLGEIRQHLEWIAKDVTPYNGAIADLVRQRIAMRRQKLLKDRGLAEGLGFAVRRRDDAPQTFVAPTVRRKAVPVPSPKARGMARPEPALALEEYEHILSVVSNMVMVMERSPQAFKGMSEEALRQHFLVQLNGQYEGQATGETFNYEDKTDILIRSEGRNIFIAECKFWDGPASAAKAIDQLLGYTSWRDTKTALLIFNRQKNFSSVRQKACEAVKAHPSMVREMPFSSETGFRVVLLHKNDNDRELILTVLVFDVPS